MGFRWNAPSAPLPKESSPRDSQTPHEMRAAPQGGHHAARGAAVSHDHSGTHDTTSITFSPGRLFNPLSFDADVPPPPPPPPPTFPTFSVRPSSYHAEGPPTIQRLIPPNTPFARAVVMGNAPHQQHHSTSASNLTMQMNQIISSQLPRGSGSDESTNVSGVDEADSASGPSPPLAQSLPAGSVVHHGGPPPVPRTMALRGSATVDTQKTFRKSRSKELGTIAPPSGSPYAEMMNKREEIETIMRNRLTALREAEPYQRIQARREAESSAESIGSTRERSNTKRNQRRAEHTQAVIDDLCEVVTDLFIAESKLLNPLNYGVSETATSRDPILNNIRSFVTSLPVRYALGVNTPSEVLLHMRLMAAARAEHAKVAVHIHSIEEDSVRAFKASDCANRSLRLVTISCQDAAGLLEYITSLLATGGSRVLDADVMTSEDSIVLDRFVVNMAGRLRLDMLSNSIEAFLAKRTLVKTPTENPSNDSSKPTTSNHVRAPSGSIYHTMAESPPSEESLQMELQSGVPLTTMLASNSKANLASVSLPMLSKRHSLPLNIHKNSTVGLPEVVASIGKTDTMESIKTPDIKDQPDQTAKSRRRKLIDRPASHDLDNSEEESMGSNKTIDYVTVPTFDQGGGALVERKRAVPLVPFDELMLIETIGTGRVSTIYRAAWQRHSHDLSSQDKVKMVALKVAMTNGDNGDTSFIDELRQEADIAARLRHPCICDLIGVAADADCFCLAYEFCSGGSLLSLLTDHSRYYEYLPIALDIANGMAYLHSRNVIHRDLKPSNILLTKTHRAKIADFGMSISNHGQELTAETGTYRYMAPEVIRHESYSSNADVYSFGICLWQLITREIPFASMTPIQAAYAVAQGHRPDIPSNTPARLREIIRACWDQDSYKRPSFTYIALALADYAKLAFSPANVGTQTLHIANELLATVEGNSTVNVDFTAPVNSDLMNRTDSFHNIGLEIE